MEQQVEPPMSDEALEAQFAADDRDTAERLGEPAYIPDPRVLWGAEAARAILVVMTRRFGPDFAREVSDELAARTLSYQAGCPDDRRDGNAMEALLTDQFWDRLFQQPPVDEPRRAAA
jgi:hypothetical protein